MYRRELAMAVSDAGADCATADIDAREPDSSVRVLHVVRSLDVGGLETALVKLIDRLHQLGFIQAVCCLDRKGTLADQLPVEIPIWCCRKPTDRRWHRHEFRASRVVRDFRPQVIHAENCGAWIDATIAWLSAGRPGKVAFTIHGWTQTERIRWRTAMLYQFLAKATAAMTAISSQTADAFAEETGIDRGRFSLLTLGIDTDEFRPSCEKDSSPDRKVIFGCVARLDKIKGIDVLIEALAMLPSEDRNRLELRLIGDGPERDRLRLVVEQKNLQGHVDFLGMRSDVVVQLQSLDVFVLPSRREGRPMSVMEAMAVGLPVLATRVGALDTLVEDGIHGRLVPPESPHALSKSMLQFLHDPSLRHRFGQNARTKAVDEFSIDRAVREHAELYRRLAAEHRKKLITR